MVGGNHHFQLIIFRRKFNNIFDARFERDCTNPCTFSVICVCTCVHRSGIITAGTMGHTKFPHVCALFICCCPIQISSLNTNVCKLLQMKTVIVVYNPTPPPSLPPPTHTHKIFSITPLVYVERRGVLHRGTYPGHEPANDFQAAFERRVVDRCHATSVQLVDAEVVADKYRPESRHVVRENRSEYFFVHVHFAGFSRKPTTVTIILYGFSNLYTVIIQDTFGCSGLQDWRTEEECLKINRRRRHSATMSVDVISGAAFAENRTVVGGTYVNHGTDCQRKSLWRDPATSALVPTPPPLRTIQYYKNIKSSF